MQFDHDGGLGEKTKDKRQKTKDKRQKTKDKRQKTKDKRQSTKIIKIQSFQSLENKTSLRKQFNSLFYLTENNN